MGEAVLYWILHIRNSFLVRVLNLAETRATANFYRKFTFCLVNPSKRSKNRSKTCIEMKNAIENGVSDGILA
jgi:hypothetical protein